MLSHGTAQFMEGQVFTFPRMEVNRTYTLTTVLWGISPIVIFHLTTLMAEEIVIVQVVQMHVSKEYINLARTQTL